MITRLFDVLVMPFGAHHTWALVVLSILTGVVMAFVFKWTSKAEAIRAAKDKVKGRILEMKIYEDDPGLIVRAFAGTMKGNALYLGTLLVPFFVLILPVMIIFMQMDERYAHAPLPHDARTILTVQLAPGLNPRATDVTLDAPSGIVQDSRVVRIRETREATWRLRAASPGTHDVTVTANGEAYTFPVVAAGGDYRMIGHERTTSWIEPILHPAMPPLPKGSAFDRVHLEYPGTRYPFLWWHVHWIVIFLIYSAVAALALKFVIKFEI